MINTSQFFSIFVLLIFLLLNCRTQDWTEYCVDIRGYPFPSVKLITGPYILPIPEKLRMELWMGTHRSIPGINPGGIYHGDVRQGECTGSLVLPNLPIILDKSNSTELYEKFIFEYKKLIVGEIFIAYGFQKQLMIRVKILANATLSRIGEYQPMQSRDTQNMTTSCLTFWDDETSQTYKYVYSTNLKPTKLSIELLDRNDQSLDRAVYQFSPNRSIFTLEYGTVKLDVAILYASRNSLRRYMKSTDGCNSNPVIYLGPATKSFRLCNVKTGYDHILNTWSISTAPVFIKSFSDYCVRAKGYYQLISRQPEGFLKTKRLNSAQIQCCTGNISLSTIC
ncbi:hypothetical protein MXB_5152 [Myxobolus squamalis]|nr:hypothetical protein MXB_5152 [Myxobolus squamalis]